MLMTKERRAAIRTLRGWAISVLQEAGAIHECEEHGWMQDRADPHARERAFIIARQYPPPGVSSHAAAVARSARPTTWLKDCDDSTAELYNPRMALPDPEQSASTASYRKIIHIDMDAFYPPWSSATTRTSGESRSRWVAQRSEASWLPLATKPGSSACAPRCRLRPSRTATILHNSPLAC
jgi:hypothetical protein